MTTKTNKPKPPILTSEAHGNLNPVESAIDSKRVIKEWCLQQGHTRGYQVTTNHWKHVFRALRMMVNSGDYPDTLGLTEALAELLRPFEYDEEYWSKYGEIKFLGSRDERKMGVYLAVNPYPKRVYSPLGENKQDNLTNNEEEDR